jgi:predicted RNase H-like HicB family nuclease
MSTTQHHGESQASVLPEGTPSTIETRIWLGRQDGYFFALSDDFDIASQGETDHEALQQLVEMVCDYLESCARDGRTYAESLRRVPLERRAKLHLRVLITKALRRQVRADGQLREGNFLVPVPC